MGLKLFQSLISKLSLFEHSHGPLKTSLARMSLFDLTQSFSIVKSLFTRVCFSETVTGKYLTLKLPEVVDKSWAKNRIAKKLKRKFWGITYPQRR